MAGVPNSKGPRILSMLQAGVAAGTIDPANVTSADVTRIAKAVGCHRSTVKRNIAAIDEGKLQILNNRRIEHPAVRHLEAASRVSNNPGPPIDASAVVERIPAPVGLVDYGAGTAAYMSAIYNGASPEQAADIAGLDIDEMRKADTLYKRRARSARHRGILDLVVVARRIAHGEKVRVSGSPVEVIDGETGETTMTVPTYEVYPQVKDQLSAIKLLAELHTLQHEMGVDQDPAFTDVGDEDSPVVRMLRDTREDPVLQGMADVDLMAMPE